jgi:hypothetical protein
MGPETRLPLAQRLAAVASGWTLSEIDDAIADVSEALGFASELGRHVRDNVDSGRWQVSPNGGTRPAWARNGRELFYLDANGLLTSVSVQTPPGTLGTPSFSASTPTKILDMRYYAGAATRGLDLRAYDVAPDGQRFLMIKDAASTEQKTATPTRGLVVVLNWFGELKARVPTK